MTGFNSRLPFLKAIGGAILPTGHRMNIFILMHINAVKFYFVLNFENGKDTEMIEFFGK